MAKDYKAIAELLCEGYLDMPSSCDGCPLYTDRRDDEGNIACDLYYEEEEE